MQQRTYMLEVILNNFDQPRLVAGLKDNYLDTLYELSMNDTTLINFVINATPASYDSYRFKLIYATLSIPYVPISFIDLKTFRVQKDVKVEWNVINETEVEKYVVEHSLDGQNFSEFQIVNANNAGYMNYNISHNDAPVTANYYRVKAIQRSGAIVQSEISKVGGLYTPIRVFPNPVVNNYFQVQIESKEIGIYSMILVTANGAILPLNSVNILPGLSSQIAYLPKNLASGVYMLRIITPGNQRQTIPLRIK